MAVKALVATAVGAVSVADGQIKRLARWALKEPH